MVTTKIFRNRICANNESGNVSEQCNKWMEHLREINGYKYTQKIISTNYQVTTLGESTYEDLFVVLEMR